LTQYRLDTAFLLNAVPERYRRLGLNPLDTYFAHGQGLSGTGSGRQDAAVEKVVQH